MMHGKTPAVDVSDSSKPDSGLTTESNGLYSGERVKKKRTVDGEESAVISFTVAVISLTL